jgi:hypothetical protein
LMRGSASIRCCKPGFNTWASKIEFTRTPRPLHCNAHEITSSFRAVAVDWNQFWSTRWYMHERSIYISPWNNLRCIPR